MISSTIPGQLRELAGISVREFDSSPVDVNLSDNFGKSRLWRDILDVETAKIIAKYDEEYYKGDAAITVNTYGKGKVWYIGCDLEDTALDKAVKMISDMADAKYISHPLGTEIIKRIANGREYHMLLNYTADKVDMGITGKSLISGKRFNDILYSYGVEII